MKQSFRRCITLLLSLCVFSVGLTGCFVQRSSATPTAPPRSQASFAIAAPATLRPTLATPDY